MHVIPFENKTRSGIHIWHWVERLENILKVEGKHNCPAFCDEDGFQLYTNVLESVIQNIFRITKRDKHHKDDIAKELEVEYWIRRARSPRREALNEAMDQGLGDSEINLIHIRKL